jgi:ribonuclease HII
MWVTGVDENGLGPRLGPLVATALTLELPRYERSALCERGLRLGLTDSKETGGFGRMGFTESVALALLSFEPERGAPSSADALLERLGADPDRRLRPCCPDSATAAQCWEVDLPLPAFGGDLDFGRGLVRRLVGRSKLRIVEVQSRVACAGVLNAKLGEGKNKLGVDLELFEDLIDDTRDRSNSARLVVCGMIGGIRDYAARFERFDSASVEPLPGRRGQRRYGVDGVGEIRFEVDADARHLPVALASIVGKYLREVCMRRIGEFYQIDSPGLKLASGYHDPVTTRFIDATELSRRARGVADSCFRRRA